MLEGGIKATQRCNPTKREKAADRQYTHLKKHSSIFPFVSLFRFSLGQQFYFMPFGRQGSREVFEGGNNIFFDLRQGAAFCANRFYLQPQPFQGDFYLPNIATGFVLLYVVAFF